MEHEHAPALKRELGIAGAVLLGLGSIIGSGVFVGIGIAAGIAGGGIVIALVLAGLLAACNALSSAQLAASHPVSGGTYEYGYWRLRPWLGFTAGWMFLAAKTASAATAAIGFAGYLLNAAGGDSEWLPLAAVGTVAALTAVALAGLRLSSGVNAALVCVSLSALAAFVVAGLPSVSADRLSLASEPSSLLHATALLFVAYTGYGRLATLGEEIRDPRRTIPRAIVITLVLSMLVYVAVAVVAVGAAGAEALSAATAQQAAPLETVSREFNLPVHRFVAVGAMTAMLGVVLNLLLGLSRVLLAMGRRGDMPAAAANVRVAVAAVGVVIGCLAATGSVRLTWSFSAFTVLIYYAITNLAALRLRAEERLYPRALAVAGLVGCCGLAFWVEPRVWLAGLGTIAAGLAWHAVAMRIKRLRVSNAARL